MDFYINRLKDLREDEDLTQEQLAKKLGYHTTTYKRWEENLHNIKLNDATNIADFYNVSLDYIAGRTNYKQGKAKPTFNDEQMNIIEKYDTLTEKNKGKLELFLDQLIESQEDHYKSQETG